MIFDAHCHVSNVWYEPAESLLFQMDRNGVEHALLTQVLGQFDNSYLFSCREHWPDRFLALVAIDLTASDPCAIVDEARARGATGIRLRPDAQLSEGDPFAIWQAAADLGLVVSCAGTMAQFASPEFAALLDRFVTLPVLLEHGAGLGRPDATDDEPVLAAIAALAAREAVYMKLPGLGQIEPRSLRFPASGRPLAPGANAERLRALGKAFRADRLMWGSDFPVVSSREGYANALASARELFGDRPPADLASMFGGSAAALFGLRDDTG